MDNSFGAHSRIFFFFFNNVGDKIVFTSVGKIDYIFGSKLDTFSKPFMTVVVLLSSSAMLFLRL